MAADGNKAPAITKGAKELLEAIRVASLSGHEPVELVILGICRKNKGGSIKKGKHLTKVVEENPDLFAKKPSATLLGRRCNLILPTSEGNKLLDTLEANNEVIRPVSLVRRQKQLGAPTLYILEGYYTDTSGCKHPLTLLFQSKLLFLEHGDVEAIPAYATEVVGEIRCLWKQCTDEVLNFQNPQPVATLPHIKHLIRYVVSRFRIDSISMSSESELEYACLLEMKRLFPGTKEAKLKLSYEQVSILRVPITKHEEVHICRNCKATSCHHLDRLSNSTATLRWEQRLPEQP
nr:hypothetical protein [Candidatus Njordarchaeota archaeon]